MKYRCILSHATFLTTLVGLAASLAAQTPRPAPETSMTDRGWLAERAVAQPWTREEMLSAVADDLPGVTEAEIAAWAAEASLGAAYDLSGGPGAIPSGLPGGQMRSAVDERAEVPGTILAGVHPRGYTHPAPFTRYETFPSYTTYPHRTVGKVFFTKPGIGNYVCSAASIGGDGVLTAGHCVRDGRTGAWWTNWVFVPAYKNGQAPYGQWSANHLWAKGAWVNGDSGDFRYDLGGAVLNRKSGKQISNRVGWLGFLWNVSANSHWTAIGYPQGAPFDGKLQQICQASFAYSASGAKPAPVGIGCDLTGGSSGGPWIRSYSKDAGQSNYLNGVNSFARCKNAACTQVNVEMFSPYFDATAKSLRDCVVNSVPGNPADPAKGCAPGT